MAEANGRDPAWWWKAAAGTLFAAMAALLLKGLDQWQQTNTALLQLSADVKYQIERVAQREVRLGQLEKNLNMLFERTQAKFDERREAADRLVNAIDDRIDRLERHLPEGGGR